MDPQVDPGKGGAEGAAAGERRERPDLERVGGELGLEGAVELRVIHGGHAAGCATRTGISSQEEPRLRRKRPRKKGRKRGREKGHSLVIKVVTKRKNELRGVVPHHTAHELGFRVAPIPDAEEPVTKCADRKSQSQIHPESE